MLKVIKELLGNALKDNKNLFRGYVTGCLRIAHQSIFTDINNFKLFGLEDESFSDFIGLTRDETERLLQRCGMESRLSDVLAWYDGYSFAGKGMLCPWSVLNFLYDTLKSKDPASFKPQNYWANSSGNDIIEICMKQATPSISRKLQNLIDGGTEEIRLCEFTSYPEISENSDFDVFATMMLHTGYFTVVRDAVPSRTGLTVIKIPNLEVLECFRNKVEAVFSRKNTAWLKKSQELLQALFDGDAKKSADTIREMLLKFLSVRDTAYESVYHSFLTGILGIAADTAEADIKSNSECGNGYADIVIKKKKIGTAMIIEFKKCDSDSATAMKKMCEAAIAQIDSQKYDFDIRQDFEIVRKYGIVFHGKDCEAVHKECRREE